MPSADVGGLWPEGRECAISLTYDGALAEHLSDVVPLLDALGLAATFFASPTRVLDDPLAWRRVSQKHEIGSHSLFGVADGGTLLNWSLSMVEADVKMTSSLISELIGQECVSIALPGWSTACGDGDYLPLTQRLVPYVRSERREINDWKTCDLGYVGSFPFGQSDVPKLAKQARSNASWLVLRTTKLDDPSKHQRLLKSLAASAEALWIAPFGTVATRLASLKQGRALSP